jgi:hypothetical protein
MIDWYRLHDPASLVVTIVSSNGADFIECNTDYRQILVMSIGVTKSPTRSSKCQINYERMERVKHFG